MTSKSFLRPHHVSALKQQEFDALIIGGGINGAVAAAALSARGLNVALIDKDDFASGTSSQSSNLAWGGIKYLESYEFNLVYKLCRSRNVLMRSFPSSVREIRFLTTIKNGFRFPVLLVYLSTIAYWIIGHFFTKKPSFFTNKKLKKRDNAINTIDTSGGFEYSDSYLPDNDARFVFNFIRNAMKSGATTTNYIEAISSKQEQGIWLTKVRNQLSNEQFTVRSKMLINACGPWVDIVNQVNRQQTRHQHLFSKGVHLIVDRKPAEHILAFFASDGRLFFVIPMGDKTCIGTTDTEVKQPETSVTAEDRSFILDNANQMLDLEAPLTEQDIIAERCGVRPLATESNESAADWVKLSRKHVIDVDPQTKTLSIFGGKLTDCLNVGEEIVQIANQLGFALNAPKQWYGEPSKQHKQAYLEKARQLNIECSSTHSQGERLWRMYGLDANQILSDIEQNPNHGIYLIPGTTITIAEVKYLKEHEMITCLEDLFRRRSMIELTTKKATLCASEGINIIAELLFDNPDDQIRQYLATY